MSLMDASRELTAVREALLGLETQAVVGAVQALTDVAESLARTTEAMRAMQPAEWMTHEQAAAYLQRTPGAFKELVRTEEVPKHYLSEQRHPLQPDGARYLAHEPLAVITASQKL